MSPARALELQRLALVTCGHGMSVAPLETPRGNISWFMLSRALADAGETDFALAAQWMAVRAGHALAQASSPAGRDFKVSGSLPSPPLIACKGAASTCRACVGIM
jgi:hypothetical protein